MTRKESKQKKLLLCGMALCLCLLVALEAWRICASDIAREHSLYSLTTSLLGSALFLLAILYCSYGEILRMNVRALPRHLLFALPCFAVALNNFPILPFLSGRAYIKGSDKELLLWLLVCLGTGLFEELVFRGYIFMMILERRRSNRRGIFFAVILSSALFGLIHLINIFGGADPFATLLQVGYSFLVGGMCAVVLLRTGSLWYSILLHAIYNFAGGIIPRLGGGVLWDAPTVIITVLLSLAVFAYLLVFLIKTEPKNILPTKD